MKKLTDTAERYMSAVSTSWFGPSSKTSLYLLVSVAFIAVAMAGKIFVRQGHLNAWEAAKAITFIQDAPLFSTADKTEKIAASQTSNNDVNMVPALTGLGAPHWAPKARGAAMLALMQTDKSITLEHLASRWTLDKKFNPSMDKEIRHKLISGWNFALQRTVT